MGDKERTYSQGEEKETESTETFNKDIKEELDAKLEKKFAFTAIMVAGLEKKLALGKTTESGAEKRRRDMDDSGSAGCESHDCSPERGKTKTATGGKHAAKHHAHNPPAPIRL